MRRERIVEVFGFGLVAIGSSSAQQASADVVQCGSATCTSSFSIFLDGASTEAGGGQLVYDAETGEIALDLTPGTIRGGGMLQPDGSGLMWMLPDGARPNSSVALSGFVQQVVVPLPAALPLLVSSLTGLGFILRRRRTLA